LATFAAERASACMRATLRTSRRWRLRLLCGSAVLLLCGVLDGLVATLTLRLAPAPRPRTSSQLLLQHYEAREVSFARQARRIVFLHIHKAAGSTLCQLAQDAGELVARDSNCNLKGEWKRALAAGTPAEQCRALRCVRASVAFPLSSCL